MSKIMNANEAIRAISGNQPIVIESRKFGIVANWYTTRDKAEFAEWLRGRMEAGAYPEHEYNITWRCWRLLPTESLRRSEPWNHAKRSI